MVYQIGPKYLAEGIPTGIEFEPGEYTLSDRNKDHNWECRGEKFPAQVARMTGWVFVDEANRVGQMVADARFLETQKGSRVIATANERFNSNRMVNTPVAPLLGNRATFNYGRGEATTYRGLTHGSSGPAEINLGGEDWTRFLSRET